MDLLDLMEQRRSVRRFRGDDIPDELIYKLLRAAQAAPSGGNCQPWHFFVIKDREIMKQVVEKSCPQQWILTAPVLIAVCAEPGRSAARYGERGNSLYCIQDTAAAVQNILLCAKSLGLGACWCGAFDEDAMAGVLNLKKETRPVALIPVGYPASEPPKPKRRPVEEIVTFVCPEGKPANLAPQADNKPIFEHCAMAGTKFDDVNLQGADFHNINLNKAGFHDINLSESEYGAVNLSASRFGCVDFKNAEFRNPDFSGARFENCRFIGAKISNCDLTGLEISGCKTDGMKIYGVPVDGGK